MNKQNKKSMSQVISNEEYAIHSVDQFESWMRNTVKSIYYANNGAMCDGYDRVYEHAKNVRFNLVKSKPRFNLKKSKV